MFKRYNSVERLIKDDKINPECDGILDWKVFIQEKIDGANLSVWLENNWMYIWSRNKVVWTPSITTGFRGAVEYINNHEGIKNLLNSLPEGSRLYWEWLVPHTITNYSPSAYNHFYLFDIEINEEMQPTDIVDNLAKVNNICTPTLLNILENPKMEDILSYVGKTTLKESGKWGEGVVIKNPDFISEWGRRAYWKLVAPEFKEENSVTFGNHSKEDKEMKIAVKYTTEWRIRKIINKIEQNEDRNIELKDITRIIGMTQHDIITEEVWEYHKEWTINFKKLKTLIGKRASLIAQWIIKWEAISVAFE